MGQWQPYKTEVESIKESQILAGTKEGSSHGKDSRENKKTDDSCLDVSKHASPVIIIIFVLLFFLFCFLLLFTSFLITFFFLLLLPNFNGNYTYGNY